SLAPWRHAVGGRGLPRAPHKPTRSHGGGKGSEPRFAAMAGAARALEDGKTVYMAVPRLADERPFFLLDPARLKDSPRKASSIKSAARSAITVDVEDMEQVDLVVCGAVAVGEDGARLGK